MACHEIKSWTFSGLVGAFVDLAIVFLLLCASTLAYLASKFLGLFGSCLPCPCNGLFGVPNSEKCWQRALVECPPQKIYSVQFSVKSKFPFDSIWDQNLNPRSNINLVNKKNHENGCVELDDQASCSSFKDRRNDMGRDVNEERFDIKGKGVLNQKGRHAIRRRRKVSVDTRRLSSVSSYDSFQLDAQTFPPPPAAVMAMVNGSNEVVIAPDSSGGDALSYGRYSSKDMELLGRESSGFESNGATDENRPTSNCASHVDDLKFNAKGEILDGSDDGNAIRILEQALEEEHTTHAALSLELEKERSAAASAADEAMAMILRLQEEKASIEMEARQYQRTIEEKAAYDFEEMNILKEILIRREREKHYLEKEVETYRQMLFGGEHLDADQDTGISHSKRASLFLYSGEDPVVMLQRISKSFTESEKVENANNISEYGASSIELQDCTLSFGKELSIPERDKVGALKRVASNPTINKCPQNLSDGSGEINEAFDEENLLAPEESQYPLDRELKTAASVGELQQQSDVTGTREGVAPNPIQTCDETNSTFYCHDDLEKDGKDANRMSNMGPHANDVHVMDNKANLCVEVGENESEKHSENVALDIPRTCDSPVVTRPQIEQDISRSCSDITSGLPPLGCSQRKLSDIRRNSMSAVDYERFKIDNEIGWLRERLRIIQEGREKLNISMEHREKEKVQLQLLENIVNQLLEIRQLTENGRAVRQFSLPSSCKLPSKKRCWQSVSLEVRRET